MKKILSIALASAACAAFADDTVVQGDSDIGVLTVTCSTTNTIIAVPFTELGFDTDICVSNIVKTTGLDADDQIYVYDNGEYECWTLAAGTGDPAPKFWQKSETKFTIDASGNPTAKEGTSPAVQTLGVGKGLWLVRKSWSGEGTFSVYLYGTYSATKTSPVVAGKYNLIANTTSAAVTPTVAGMVNGDRIYVVGNGAPQPYIYSSSAGAWRTVTYAVVDGKAKSTITTGLPSIAAGHGVWYQAKAGSAAVVTWGN